MVTERLIWMLFGMCVGFVVGYQVRGLREIKEGVEEVGEIVRKNHRNEGGFMRFPIVADIALLLAIFLTGWASFTSQKASNEVVETQAQLKTVTHCNQVYLGALLKAVDERTGAATKAINSNVDLQKSWYDFVVFQLHLPPYPEAQQREKANKYRDSLKMFLDLSAKSKEKVVQNPYPTDEQLSNCINKEN